MRPFDNTVVDQHVAKIALTFGANFNRCRGRDNGAVSDNDVFTWSSSWYSLVFLSTIPSSPCLNVTVTDTDITTVIGVNAIAVRDIETVFDGDAINHDIFAPGRMHGPLGTIAEGKIGDAHARTAEQTDAPSAPCFAARI